MLRVRRACMVVHMAMTAFIRQRGKRRDRATGRRMTPGVADLSHDPKGWAPVSWHARSRSDARRPFSSVLRDHVRRGGPRMISRRPTPGKQVDFSQGGAASCRGNRTAGSSRTWPWRERWPCSILLLDEQDEGRTAGARLQALPENAHPARSWHADRWRFERG